MQLPLLESCHLLNIVGRRRVSNTILFHAAWLELNDWQIGQSKHELEDYLKALPDLPGNWPFPRDSYTLFGDVSDAVWVRSRLPSVFGFAPAGLHGEWSCTLDVAFLAIGDFEGHAGRTAIPFACANQMEEYGLGNVGLYFSRSGPNRAVQNAIASAFWDLLLAAPAECSTWELIGRVAAEGTFEIERIGCDREGFFLKAAYFDDPESLDNHLGFIYGDWQPCFDCDGTGIEDWFPYTDDCATCQGTGRVTW